MSDNKLNESISELNDLKEKIGEAASKADDVQSGELSAEEEQQEPEYILLNKITDMVIEVLQLPSFVEGFNTISLIVGEESAKKVAEMMAVAMSHSATSAIMFYDEYLNNELSKQFDRYGEALNNTIAVVNGMSAAIEVLKQRIGDVEKKVELLKIESE